MNRENKQKRQDRTRSRLLTLLLLLPVVLITLIAFTSCSDNSAGQEYDPHAPECSNNVDDDLDGDADEEDIGCIDQTGAYEVDDNHEETKERVEEISNFGADHIFVSGAEGEREKYLTFDDGVIGSVRAGVVQYSVEIKVRLMEGADPAGFAIIVKAGSFSQGRDEEPIFVLVSDILAEGDESTDWKTYEVNFGPQDFPADKFASLGRIYIASSAHVRGEEFTNGNDGYEFKHPDMPHAAATITTGVYEPEEMPD